MNLGAKFTLTRPECSAFLSLLGDELEPERVKLESRLGTVRLVDRVFRFYEDLSNEMRSSTESRICFWIDLSMAYYFLDRLYVACPDLAVANGQQNSELIKRLSMWESKVTKYPELESACLSLMEGMGFIPLKHRPLRVRAHAAKNKPAKGGGGN